MLVIENCNSLSELRQKLIDGEEVRTARQEPCEDAISRQAVLDAIDVKAWEFCDYLISKNRNDEQKPVSHFADNLRECVREELPSVNPQAKTGHWVYKIYGEFHEQGDWYCSHCDYQYNYGNGHAKFCPECGYEMSEPPTEEVIGDKDYDWVIKR